MRPSESELGFCLRSRTGEEEGEEEERAKRGEEEEGRKGGEGESHSCA